MKMQPGDYIHKDDIPDEATHNRIREAVRAMGYRVGPIWGTWGARNGYNAEALDLHLDGDLVWSAERTLRGRRLTPADILDTAPVCRWCVDEGTARTCGDAQPKGPGYVCTRQEGHSGDHVACSGSTHALATWPHTDGGSLPEPEVEIVGITDDRAPPYEPEPCTADLGHPAAELLADIAAEARVNPEPWTAYEWWDEFTGKGWIKAPRRLSTLAHRAARSPENVRRKPRTITINGRDVPEPCREPLERGQTYYYPAPDQLAGFLRDSWVSDHPSDCHRLHAGLVHLTPEAAKAHSDALVSFTQKEEQ